MSDYALIRAAKEAAGLDTGPQTRSWVQPRHQPPDDEPEVVETQPEPPRIGVGTRTKPIPVGDQGPRPTPSGGTEPHKVVIDHAAEIRELADRVWRRQNG